MSIAVMTIAIYGVEKDGCTLPITDGNCFCSAIANGTREPDNIRIFRLPVMEIIAPAEIIVPPSTPRKRTPASANGF